MPDVIQSLWIGGRLSALERLAITSFLRCGHEFHLYAYGEIDAVPEGTLLRDASGILPSSAIFQYRDQRSYAGFSNFFRYKLLLERGGWWVDADVVCLRPFDFDNDYVFASEKGSAGELITSAVIKAPPGSEPMSWAWSVCRSKDTAALKWGETGPALVAEMVGRFDLGGSVQPARTFCPIRDNAWASVVAAEPPPLADDAHAVHFWNERWRRNGRDKDAAYPRQSLYERLKRRYGVA